MTQAQHPQTLSYQKPQSFQKFNQKTPDVDGWYPSQLKLQKQWEEEMERLNAKYNLDFQINDFFSRSKLIKQEKFEQ